MLSTTYLLLALAVGAGDANRLVVKASGFTHARGHAIAKLFQPGDIVTQQGRWQRVAPILDGRAQFEVPGLQAGSYAVVVFNDENDKGVIDHNALGLPREPLGFSNGFSLGLFSGKPTFEKLRFEHNESPQDLEVRVK